MLFGIAHLEPDWRLAAYLGLTWICHLSLADPHCLPMLAMLVANMHSNFYGKLDPPMHCNVSLHTVLGFSSLHILRKISQI